MVLCVHAGLDIGSCVLDWGAGLKAGVCCRVL